MAHVIAVAGKGGVGKTTLCGMLIQYLCEKGKGPILAVDADANSNLNEVLGVKVETTLGDVREEIAVGIQGAIGIVRHPEGGAAVGLVKLGDVLAVLPLVVDAQAELLDPLAGGQGHVTFSRITNRGIKISKEKKAVPEKTGATITIYCSLS